GLGAAAVQPALALPGGVAGAAGPMGADRGGGDLLGRGGRPGGWFPPGWRGPVRAGRATGRPARGVRRGPDHRLRPPDGAGAGGGRPGQPPAVWAGAGGNGAGARTAGPGPDRLRRPGAVDRAAARAAGEVVTDRDRSPWESSFRRR